MWRIILEFECESWSLSFFLVYLQRPLSCLDTFHANPNPRVMRQTCINCIINSIPTASLICICHLRSMWECEELGFILIGDYKIRELFFSLTKIMFFLERFKRKLLMITVLFFFLMVTKIVLKNQCNRLILSNTKESQTRKEDNTWHRIKEETTKAKRKIQQIKMNSQCLLLQASLHPH